MKYEIVILMVALLLSGCGTFKHQQQTYYIEEVLRAGISQPKPVLRVQIVPTVESTHVPLFYYSRKWGGPYSISFSANSRIDVCTHFLLHSFRFTSEKRLIEEKLFSTPLKMELCGSELGDRNNHSLYRYLLDDSFKFVEGSKIELEVKYERPDGVGVRSILFDGVGEEKKSNTSLFSAYMGV